MKITINLQEIKMARAICQEPAPVFGLGEITEMHQIGPYDVAEFHPWKKGKASARESSPDVTEFFAWVNGVDVPGTWSTLDEALIGCIKFRKQKK